MLSDRITTILDTMHVSISEVARAGGCTPSNLNRVKNGVRTPPPSSPTIRWLTIGLIAEAHHRNMTGELCGICGADLKDSSDVLRAKLTSWLYEDEPPYIRQYKKQRTEGAGSDQSEPSPSTEFSHRLDRLMNTADLSNRRLGMESGLDPSYVSRLRRGKRIPRYQSPYLTRICKSVMADMTAEGRISDLSDLTALTETELTEEDGVEALRSWLFGYGSVTGYMAADELMEAVASVHNLIKALRAEAARQPDIEKLLEEIKTDGGAACGDEDKYIGIDGFRAAVTRFLTDMIRDGDNELLLYSDQSMDWMGGEFRRIIMALMSVLIQRDVRIRVIHTVNRSMSELASAVEWWMPLYLSGKIQSYYCIPSAGKRFSHTLFIRPGKACVAGTSVIGLEDRTVYRLSPNDDATRLAEEAFGRLLQDSSPLVQISESSEDLSDNEGFIQSDKVMVKAGQDQVAIRRTEPPYLMFTFTHPMIVRAFSSYVNGRF